MINRHYFLSVRKYHNDGSGGYLWRWTKFTYRSWFKQNDKALDEMLDVMLDEFEIVDKHELCVIAFNRL